MACSSSKDDNFYYSRKRTIIILSDDEDGDDEVKTKTQKVEKLEIKEEPLSPCPEIPENIDNISSPIGSIGSNENDYEIETDTESDDPSSSDEEEQTISQTHIKIKEESHDEEEIITANTDISISADASLNDFQSFQSLNFGDDYNYTSDSTQPTDANNLSSNTILTNPNFQVLHDIINDSILNCDNEDTVKEIKIFCDAETQTIPVLILEYIDQARPLADLVDVNFFDQAIDDSNLTPEQLQTKFDRICADVNEQEKILQQQIEQQQFQEQIEQQPSFQEQFQTEQSTNLITDNLNFNIQSVLENDSDIDKNESYVAKYTSYDQRSQKIFPPAHLNNVVEMVERKDRQSFQLEDQNEIILPRGFFHGQNLPDGNAIFYQMYKNVSSSTRSIPKENWIFWFYNNTGISLSDQMTMESLAYIRSLPYDSLLKRYEYIISLQRYSLERCQFAVNLDMLTPDFVKSFLVLARAAAMSGMMRSKNFLRILKSMREVFRNNKTLSICGSHIDCQKSVAMICVNCHVASRCKIHCPKSCQDCGGIFVEIIFKGKTLNDTYHFINTQKKKKDYVKAVDTYAKNIKVV